VPDPLFMDSAVCAAIDRGVGDMMSVRSVLRGIVIVAGNAVGLIARPDGRHRSGRG
jgi:hypothetical protein